MIKFIPPVLLAIMATGTPARAWYSVSPGLSPVMSYCYQTLGRQACICISTLSKANVPQDDIVGYCSQFNMPQPTNGIQAPFITF
jgi:hypothetical protein